MNRYNGGNLPYGWCLRGGQVTEDPAQQEIITQMKEMQAAGSSFLAIATALNKQDVAPPRARAREWWSQTVKAILERSSQSVQADSRTS